MGKPVIVEIEDDKTTEEQFFVQPKETGVEITGFEATDESKPGESKVKTVKKVMKKKKVIKRKTVIDEEDTPQTTEEVIEESIPVIETISCQDEQETTVEGVIRPVRTDIKNDRVSEAEIFITEEKIGDEDVKTEVFEDVKMEDVQGKKVRKSIKKKKVTKRKEIVDDKGTPVITEEITEEEIPESSKHVVLVEDVHDTTIDADMKPVIVKIEDDKTTEEQFFVQPKETGVEITGFEATDESKPGESKVKTVKKVMKKKRVIKRTTVK